MAFNCSSLFLLMAILYCHLWPDQLLNISLYYLIHGTIFGKKWKDYHKVPLEQGHEGPEGKYRHRSTLSLTLVFDWWWVVATHHLLYPWE
jgi:hypothetical protein